jgi:hypothetical protein
VQGALAYDIVQSIFVGPDNLAVEGLSDCTYLTVLSDVLGVLDRVHLDPRRRVLPAGGPGSVAAAIAPMGQQLDVTVVVNGRSHPPRILDGLGDAGVPGATRVIMLGPIAEMDMADVEDLFDPEDILVTYNGTFGSSLTVDQLHADGDRVLARIQQVEGDIDHGDFSNWLLRNRKAASYVLRPMTLDRFERLVQAINDTLAPMP